MPGDHIRLLALDGGGVRGLSSLMILRRFMTTVEPESPPKPCEYFDMIGGTSTGGLIAIMLGRLQMTVDECIEAYTCLSDKVFEKKSHRVKINGRLQGRFDAAALEDAIKRIVRARGLNVNELLKDTGAYCKVFVCATSKQTSDTVCLTSYGTRRSDNTDLLNSATIWQACRATSAATTFFDPIAIGPFDEEFVDGALGTNNPVYVLWNEAQDVWGNQLQEKLQCIVSIGTGVPNLKPVRDDALGIWATLKDLATETEKTAQQFHRDKSSLDDEGRYYRFNVDHGLEGIGLEESKRKNEIAAATRRYVESQTVFKQMRACANILAGIENHEPYRTVFSLERVPASDYFIDRPSDMIDIEQHLLPQRLRFQREQRPKIFVLYGLGGIGKTQMAANFARRHQATFSSVFWLDGRSEDRLRQSLAGCASRIPQGQIPDRCWNNVPGNADDLDIVVADVLDWLALPDNADWLLIFDNVDLDNEQGAKSAFDVRRYLPGDHGSVLVTTRLSRLAQLGHAKHLKKVDENLSKSIFEKWCGGKLVMDGTGRELLSLLDGLPLALAQAAAYCRETGLDTASYVRLYKQHWDDLMRPDPRSDSPLLDYDQRSIGTTWAISFRAVETRSKNAANLLRLWAFIANKDLWHGLLQSAMASKEEQWPEWLRAMACSEVKFLDAVKLLLSYSLIEVQDPEQRSYCLHPVVHRWMSHMQDPSEKKEFIRLAIILLGSSMPDQTTKDFSLLQRRLLAHVERVSWWMKEIYGQVWNPDRTVVTKTKPRSTILFLDPECLPEAEALFLRALLGCEKALESSHASALTTANNLSVVHKAQGRLTDAEAGCQRVLQVEEKALSGQSTTGHGQEAGTRMNELSRPKKSIQRINRLANRLGRALT